MIKRRFYRLEHADTNDAADSSSSSDSDLELEGQATEESEDDPVAEVNGNDESCSTSSGLFFILYSLFLQILVNVFFNIYLP